jgi:hypothetical protein
MIESEDEMPADIQTHTYESGNFSGSDVEMLTLTSVYRHYRRVGKPDVGTAAEVRKGRKL